MWNLLLKMKFLVRFLPKTPHKYAIQSKKTPIFATDVTLGTPLNSSSITFALF